MNNEAESSQATTSVLIEHNKYRRILKRRASKAIQDAFFRYFNYIFSMASSNKMVITIFKYIILIQVMGTALQITNIKFWGTETTMSKILRIFTVLISLAPSSLDSSSYSLVVLIVSIISLVLVAIILSSIYYFNVESKLPSVVVTFIAISVGCYMPYMIYCNAIYLAHEIDSLSYDGIQGLAIANIVLTVIVLAIFFCFHTIFVPSVLFFRPTVNSIFFNRDAQIFVAFNAISIFLTQIGANSNTKATQIVAIFGFIGDVVVFLLTFKRYIWLSDNFKQFCSGMTIINICFRIIISAISLAGKSGHETIVICYVVLIIVNLIRGPIMERTLTAKILAELENYTGMDFFESNSHNKVIGMLKTGFFHGSPKIHSWTYIDDALTKYPNNRAIIILYARFAAIYPEEVERVRDATIKLISIKKHDFECKKLINDLQALLQLRERNLPKGLKKQLNKVKEKSDRCISQTRRIWECVIRGSTSEIDSLSMQLQKQSKAVAKEYSQLLLIYPNNPFVARSYSQFMQNVMSDIHAANEYHQVYQSLKVGRQLQTEKGYYFTTTEVPTLPTDKEHSVFNAENPIPLVSGSVKGTTGLSQQSFIVGMSATSFNEGIEGGGNTLEISPEMQYVENSIQSIRLPSMKIARALILFMHIVICLATTVPFLILIPQQFTEQINASLGLRYIASMYENTMQIIIMSIQYASSSLGWMSTMSQRFTSLVGFDIYNMSDKEILLNLIKTYEENSQDFELKMPIMKNTGFFTKSLDMCFNKTGEITIYTTPKPDGPKVDGLFSMQSYVLFVIKTAMQIIEDPSHAFNNTNFITLTHGVIKEKQFWDAIIEQTVRDATSMFAYRIDVYKIMLIFDLIFSVVLDLIIIGVVVYLVQHEKYMISNAFKAIPKRSISQIVQKLNKALNKNIENDNEKKLDTQEENALRILSISNNTSKVDVKLIAYFICPQITLIISFVIMFCFMYIVPTNISNSVSLILPQFNDLVKAPSAVQVSLATVLRYRLHFVPGYLTNHPDDEDFNKTMDWIQSDCLDVFPNLVHEWWYGDSVTSGMLAANAGDMYTEIFSVSTCTPESMIGGITGAITCASIETSAYAILRSFSDILETDTIMVGDPRISSTMIWSDKRLSEGLVNPGIQILEQLVKDQNQELYDRMTTPVGIMIVITILIGFYAVFGMQVISDATVGTIRLFLQADPHDIINSKTILKILSNDFSSNDDDSLTKDTSFYEMLVSNLLDGTVFMDNNLNILSANKSIENILGVSASDVIGKKLGDIAHAPEGKEQALTTFMSALHTAMNALRSPRITMEAEILRNGEPIMVEFNVIAVSLIGEVQTAPANREGLAMVIIVMRDTTPAMTAKKLLDDEHDKGEHLLKMILPDIIVRKLQRGESNISFSVPSASILFMDIVSFTPWCGSLPAKTVMATLNKMFKMFDTALSRYDKMIKIKCIGDCYMAAGGIFDEVNNPAIHAKQAISFCLDAINGLSLFDIENKVQLRIRAGINCGGPIIAGVLGIEKPTFDILGSAISVAASIEHNGVPMNVHIPQHMYDLVYDQDFVFKERGDIQIKEKMVHTYLVSGYTSKGNN